MSLLEAAMENASWELNSYLDLETGDVLTITSEFQQELERIYEENVAEDDDKVDLERILAAKDIPDWQKEVLRDADQVEQHLGARYVSVPRADSDEAYRDMEDFIAETNNRRLQGRLEEAIRGRHPFRRFKDVLLDYPEDREQWFAFSNSRVRGRTLDWLRGEGIEAI